MKLYKLTNKELSKELFEFGKTTYGKVTFLLSYSVFFFVTLYLFGILFGIMAIFEHTLREIEIMLFIDLISFVLGSIHFYKELGKYINAKAR